MSLDSRTVSLAWTVQVPASQLGARLEAYVETKAAMTTFRACITHSTSPSMSNLPAEVVLMIDNELRDITYIPKIKEWLKAEKCYTNKCNVRDHFSKNYVANIMVGCDGHEDFVDQWLFEDGGDEIHEMRAQTHLQKLIKGVRKDGRLSIFKKCRNICIEDFNLDPYFTVLTKTNRALGFPKFGRATVHAYLAIPLVAAQVKSEPGLNKATWTVQHKVNPTNLLEGISMEVKQRFKAALQALMLDTPHLHFSKQVQESTEEWNERTSAPKPKIESDSDRDGSEEDSEADYWARRMKTQVQCADCGSEKCRGKMKVDDPELMLLGSGAFKAYFDED